MNKKDLKDFNISDIVERRISFAEENASSKGAVKAYSDMLTDIKAMSEEEFIAKYTEVVNKATALVNYEKTVEEDVDDLISYNNAVVSILNLLHVDFEYEKVVQ